MRQLPRNAAGGVVMADIMHDPRERAAFVGCLTPDLSRVKLDGSTFDKLVAAKDQPAVKARLENVSELESSLVGSTRISRWISCSSAIPCCTISVRLISCCPMTKAWQQC